MKTGLTKEQKTTLDFRHFFIQYFAGRSALHSLDNSA